MIFRKITPNNRQERWNRVGFIKEKLEVHLKQEARESTTQWEELELVWQKIDNVISQ